MNEWQGMRFRLPPSETSVVLSIVSNLIRCVYADAITPIEENRERRSISLTDAYVRCDNQIGAGRSEAERTVYINSKGCFRL